MNNEKLKRVIDGIRSITSSLNLDELLMKIVANTREVFHGGDSSYLQLYDPETGLLVTKAYAGLDDSIQLFKTSVGESITGKTFQEGISKVYYTSEEMADGMKNISEENLKIINNSLLIKDRTVKAVLCTPVIIGNQPIGVMTIHTYNVSDSLELDLLLLEGFAAQAAVAIQNARMYEETKHRLASEINLSKQLKEKNDLLLKGNQIHKKLSQLSLQNQGVGPIVNELEKMLSVPVVFFNDFEEKFYPTQQSNFNSIQQEILIYLSVDHNPIFVDTEDGKRYYVYLLKNKRIFLGSLIMDITELELTHTDHIVIEQGRTILMLELVKQQTLTEVYYKRTHDFFNELLQNVNTKVLLEKGKEQGINLSAPLMTAVIEATPLQDLQLLEYNIHRLVSKLKEKLHHFNILIFGFHNKVTILFSLPDSQETSRLLKTLNTVIKQWMNDQDSLLIAGIGSPYEGIAHIKTSYDEANKSIAYAKSVNKYGMIKYEEIGINRFFLHQDSNGINTFLMNILLPLQTEYAQSSDLENTLLAYIKLNKSPGKTAKELHIHINTLYKRLEKIEELLNLSFNNAEEVLKIQLACHFKETFSKGE